MKRRQIKMLIRNTVRRNFATIFVSFVWGFGTVIIAFKILGE